MDTRIYMNAKRWIASTQIPCDKGYILILTMPSGGSPKTKVCRMVQCEGYAKEDQSWSIMVGYLMGFDAKNTRKNVEEAQAKAITNLQILHPEVFAEIPAP